MIDRAYNGDEYERAVRVLRDRGCCCVLRWDAFQRRCIPATGCTRHDDRSTCYFVSQAPQQDAPCSDDTVPTPTAI